MKTKILSFLFFLFIFAIPLAGKVIAEEKITYYFVDINIQTNGGFTVLESIYYDFGSESRHGIIREIPYIKTNSQGKKFKLDINVNSVFDEFTSKEHKYVVSKKDGFVSIKVGDPDKTVSGINRYAIAYEVKGGFTYFSDHDELYWNAIGTDWKVPIDQPMVRVDVPYTMDQLPTYSCFAGPAGSTNQECFVDKLDDRLIFHPKNLNPQEGVTIVLGFPKGIINVIEPEPVVDFQDTAVGKIFFTLFGLVSIFWYILYPIWIGIKWYLSGRDPNVDIPATSYFDAPKTKAGRSLTPAETGALVDEKVDHRDILATIVDLARRGHFKIVEREKKDFYLEKNLLHVSAEKVANLPNFEAILLTALFQGSGQIRVKDANLIETFKRVEEMVYESLVADGFFPKNPQKTRVFYHIIGAVALITFNFQLVFAAFLFGRHMPKKTIFGAEEKSKAKALKNFLKSQERQLEFQADKQVMFEKLLPFAIAFGVEKVWVKRFADLNLSQPDWYQGHYTGSFSADNFSKSLGSSFSSFTSVATPTSSSSGFSSGFSGGSSGGGGGGGGGGSW